MLSLPLNEPFRPTNNTWLNSRSPDSVIVFVHGVLSDSQQCWYHEPTEHRPGVYWPDLLQRDSRFDAYSIYLGGYSTGIESGPFEVSDCAQQLFDSLKRPQTGNSGAVLDRKTIIFVCHSMGGVVVRYLLTTRPGKFEDKKLGLALIASPSSGSNWANRLDLLIKYFQHEQAKSLKWGSWNIEDLDRRFQIILDDKAIPQLFGKEACEHRFVIRRKWWPPFSEVVVQKTLRDDILALLRCSLTPTTSAVSNRAG